MKATIQDGKLSIDVDEFVHSLTHDDRKVFAQYAVFQESLVSAVVDQLVTGQCFDGWWVSGFAQRLRLKLLPILPDVMIELVTGLLEENKKRVSSINKHEAVLDGLLRSWPKGLPCPQESSYVRPDFRSVSAEEAEAYIVESLGADEWQAIKSRHAESTASVELPVS